MGHRSELQILVAWHNEMLITFGGGNGVNYGVGEAVGWLAEHPRCDVVIENEYGGLVETPDKPARSQE